MSFRRGTRRNLRRLACKPSCATVSDQVKSSKKDTETPLENPWKKSWRMHCFRVVQNVVSTASFAETRKWTESDPFCVCSASCGLELGVNPRILNDLAGVHHLQYIPVVYRSPSSTSTKSSPVITRMRWTSFCWFYLRQWQIRLHQIGVSHRSPSSEILLVSYWPWRSTDEFSALGGARKKNETRTVGSSLQT